MNDQIRLGPTLFESLWRYRVAVVGGMLLFGVVGYLVALQEAPSYDATATLFLSDRAETPGLQAAQQTYPEELVPQQAARASSRTVLEEAAALLPDQPSPEELADRVTVTADVGHLLLQIQATAGSAEGAADAANAVATAFMTLNEQREAERAAAAVAELEQQVAVREEQLRELESQLDADSQNLAVQSQIQSLSSRLVELESAVQQVRIEAGLRGSGVDVFEPAEVPAAPARPRPAVTAAALAVLGMVVASVWAYWQAGRSQRVLTRGEPEQILGVPLLGEIPLYRMRADDPLEGLTRIDPAASEAYEFVLSSVEFALHEMGGRSILVTSTLPGDGKSTTALQLAIAASRDRRRVVVVDADIRARGLSSVLGSTERIGLSDMISLDLELSDAMRRYRFSEQSTIPIVTAGQRRADPAALLRTAAFRRTIRRIRDTAELLIVDTSPLLAVADATIVAGAADGVVLVVSHGTPVSELEKVKERLKFVSTPLLGYVFNKSESTSAAAYGYGYGLEEDLDGRKRLLPRRDGRFWGKRRAASAPDTRRDSAGG